MFAPEDGWLEDYPRQQASPIGCCFKHFRRFVFVVNSYLGPFLTSLFWNSCWNHYCPFLETPSGNHRVGRSHHRRFCVEDFLPRLGCKCCYALLANGVARLLTIQGNPSKLQLRNQHVTIDGGWNDPAKKGDHFMTWICFCWWVVYFLPWINHHFSLPFGRVFFGQTNLNLKLIIGSTDGHGSRSKRPDRDQKNRPDCEISYLDVPGN